MIVREIRIETFCDVCWKDSDHEKRTPATVSKTFSVVSEGDSRKIKPRLVEVCDEHSYVDISTLSEFLDKYGTDPEIIPRQPHAPTKVTKTRMPKLKTLTCPVPGCDQTKYGPFQDEAGLERHKTRVHKTS